jgi:hypothetical protein
MSLFNNQRTNERIQPKNLFAGIEEAHSSDRDPYIIPGAYPILRIDSMRAFWSEREKTDFFIVHFEIIESNVEDRPIGTRVCWMKDFNKEITLGLIKKLVAAILDEPIEKVTGDICNELIADDNPANGRLISCQATLETSKKTGRDYTKEKWIPIPEEIQNQSDELRAKAGFPPF